MHFLSQKEGELSKSLKLYIQVSATFPYICKGAVIAAPVLINKTGQGSFPDLKGNMLAQPVTIWLHFLPLFPPPHSTAPYTLLTRKSCWPTLTPKPGQGLIHTQQSHAKEHGSNSAAPLMVGRARAHSMDLCSLLVRMQPERAVLRYRQEAIGCVQNISRVWSQAG